MIEIHYFGVYIFFAYSEPLSFKVKTVLTSNLKILSISTMATVFVMMLYYENNAQ